jgi:hypothetical protein
LLIGNGSNYTVATLGTGTGISTTTGSGTLTINNTGVTSAVAGTGIGVSGATGAVTISNTGVTSFTSSSGLSTNTSATGAVSVTNTGVTSIVAGTNITVSGSTGAVTINASSSSGATVTPTTTSATYYLIGTTTTSGTLATASISNTNAVYYNANNGYLYAIAHQSTSDRSLKTDIKKIDSALDKIVRLNGYYFAWKNSGKQSVGVMADEVEKEFPMLVDTNEDTGIKSVNYDGLIGVLIEAVAELAKDR